MINIYIKKLYLYISDLIAHEDLNIGFFIGSKN